MRILLVVSACVLVAACGDSGQVTEVTTRTDNGTTSVQTARGDASVSCDQKPDFLPLYAGARPTFCSSGTSESDTKHVAGIVMFAAPAAKPIDIVTWYKQQAARQGMEDGIHTDLASGTYSAQAKDGSRRFMVMAEAAGNDAKVTINWSTDAK